MPTLSLLMLLQDDALAAALIERLREDKLLKDLVLLSEDSQGGLDPQQERLPDVLILDLELQNEQGADGLAILHKLRSNYSEIRVIALFPAEDPAIKHESIKLGAFYTLAKRSSTEDAVLDARDMLDLDELVLAIRRAARARIEDAMVAVAYAESGDYDTVNAVMAPGMLSPAQAETTAASIRTLVAGDDHHFLARLARKLTPRRVAVRGIVPCDRVLTAIRNPAVGPVDVVVLNAAGNPGGCLETLRQINRQHLATQVILLADADEADALRECTALGAFDCLLHPVDVDHLVERLEDASHHAKQALQATHSQESAEAPRALGDHTATA